MTDRERLIEFLLKVPCGYDGAGADGIADHLLAHGVTVREQGWWMIAGENSTGNIYICSACKFPHNPNRRDVGLVRVCEKPPFCPNCGARMEGNHETY